MLIITDKFNEMYSQSVVMSHRLGMPSPCVKF